jgi:steroid delta-isomerase-like uncharacterized protein
LGRSIVVLTPDELKAFMLRYFDAWERCDLDALPDLVTPDVIDHAAYDGQAAGIDGYREFFRYWQAAFPGFRAEVHDLIAEGDCVVARWSFHGTHQGEYAGIPATGREVSFRAVSIARIENGRVAEEWYLADELALLDQLKVVAV